MHVTPAPSSPEAHWHAALAEGRLLLQLDTTTGKTVFPPRLVGPGGGELEWIEASGKGTVHSTTTIFPRPPGEPYNVVLVDLAEGARMMGRVEGIAPQDVAIGMAVSARIVVGDDGALVVFHPG